MKNVIAIESVHGNYFKIGKDANGYYLKNRYTEIPNEFRMYDLTEVEELFEGLCDRIPESKRVLFPKGHPNANMRVIYDDGSSDLYTEGEDGLNLCAFTGGTAEYSEFFTGMFFGGRSELITLDHLRKVCCEKAERYDTFLEALMDFEEDDYLFLKEERYTDGRIAIDKLCYSNRHKDFITLSSDGHIGNDGNLKFVQLMKEHGVRVM